MDHNLKPSIGSLASAAAGESSDNGKRGDDSLGECQLSTDELAEWRAAGDLVIADTRPAREFDRVRIPGSIHVPTFALQTKTYLRSKRLLLVGRQGSGADLAGLCGNLRRDGFEHVAVLDGSLQAWARQGGELVGDPAAQRGLDRISAADIAREREPDRWIVADVTTEDAPEAGDLLPGARRLSAPAGRLAKELRRVLRENHRGEEDSFVLVADARGDTYERLKAELQSLALPHLYFLEGGADAYRAYQSQQRQIALSAARGCPDDRCGAQ